MKLRPYQLEAAEAILADIKNIGAALAVLPTGSGKSHIIAYIVSYITNRYDTPVLILQPSQELLEQNVAKLLAVMPDLNIGVYSASFGRKEIRHITFATIQSIYKIPEQFKMFKLVIVDEAHLYPVKARYSMYGNFFREMGDPKVIGLTATAYRMEIGYERLWNEETKSNDLYASTMLKIITRAKHKDIKEKDPVTGKMVNISFPIFWKRIVYVISHKELFDAGYLAPIKYVHKPLMPYKEIPVNKSRTDYDVEAYGEIIRGFDAVTIGEIRAAEKRHKSLLVFCPTIENAELLASQIKGSECVFGSTDTKKRKAITDGFKNGSIKTVFNVGCLTTGFDHPALDAIFLLRPTRSPILYNQMIGRITRTAPGKEFGTVYDLTGASKALGRIETFEMYQNQRGLWDLRTERHPTWNNRVMFKVVL